MGILAFLLIVLLVLLPFGELLRFSVGNNIIIKPQDILVGIIGVIWVIFYSRIFTKPFTLKFLKEKQITMPLLAFGSIGLLSLLLNSSWLTPNEFVTSFLYWVRWVFYSLLFFVILSVNEKIKQKITFLLIVSGICILIAGFVQYFFFSSLKSLYYLGWDDHMYRMFSVFLDPNFTGAFFVLYFLFIGGKLYQLLQRFSYKQLRKNKTELKQGVFMSSILIFTFIAICLTFSRSALLMLLVGLGTFLILINKKKLIVMMLFVLVFFALIASPHFYVENINLFREASGKARLENYATAVKIIQEQPLTGIGFNSYRYAKESYGIPSGWTHVPSHADAGVDNSFLFVLVTTGIPGLLIYLWLWAVVLRRAFYLYRQKSNIMALIVFSSSLALFTSALFINSLFFPAFMLWIFILIGLMESK